MHVQIPYCVDWDACQLVLGIISSCLLHSGRLWGCLTWNFVKMKTMMDEAKIQKVNVNVTPKCSVNTEQTLIVGGVQLLQKSSHVKVERRSSTNTSCRFLFWIFGIMTQLWLCYSWQSRVSRESFYKWFLWYFHTCGSVRWHGMFCLSLFLF